MEKEVAKVKKPKKGRRPSDGHLDTPVVRAVRKQLGGERRMQFLECLKNNGGLVTMAINSFNKLYPNQRPVSMDEHGAWRANHADYVATCAQIKEGMLDVAEGVLLTLVKQQSLPATQYFLNNQGKRRGYNQGDKLEIEHTGTINHKVAIINFEERPE